MTSITDGDRVKVDGKPGTVLEGWDAGDRFYINIRLDNGEKRCMLSGSHRIEKNP